MEGFDFIAYYQVGKVTKHGMPFVEFFFEGWRIPWMAVGTDFTAVFRKNIEQRRSRLIIFNDGIIDEIRRHSTITIEELLNKKELLNVINGRINGLKFTPFILFSVDRYKESDYHVFSNWSFL